MADDGKIPDKYLKHNNYYKLGDITDERTREIISSKVQRARHDCPGGPYINSPLEDVDVIVPKDDSLIVQEVLSSDTLKDFIDKNYNRLKSGEKVSGSIDFKEPFKNNGNFRAQTDLFTVLHYADIVDAKMDKNGDIELKLVDYYDFSKLKRFKDLSLEEKIKTLKKPKSAFINEGFTYINNNAYEQQKHGKMKPYAIYKKIKYHL